MARNSRALFIATFFLWVMVGNQAFKFDCLPLGILWVCEELVTTNRYCICLAGVGKEPLQWAGDFRQHYKRANRSISWDLIYFCTCPQARGSGGGKSHLSKVKDDLWLKQRIVEIDKRMKSCAIKLKKKKKEGNDQGSRNKKVCIQGGTHSLAVG